ncbi:MAG: hypothetical protein ACRCYY_16635 [Trueperaceae bacterium]
MWDETNLELLEPVFTDKVLIDEVDSEYFGACEISVSLGLYVLPDGRLVYAQVGQNLRSGIAKIWSNFEAYKADVHRGYYTNDGVFVQEGQLLEQGFWFNETPDVLLDFDCLEHQLRAVQRALDLHLY